jgi:hypothetical protein
MGSLSGRSFAVFKLYNDIIVSIIKSRRYIDKLRLTSRASRTPLPGVRRVSERVVIEDRGSHGVAVGSGVHYCLGEVFFEAPRRRGHAAGPLATYEGPDGVPPLSGGLAGGVVVVGGGVVADEDLPTNQRHSTTRRRCLHVPRLRTAPPPLPTWAKDCTGAPRGVLCS